MQPVMRSMASFLGGSTVVTDGGSTKQDVVALARAELRAHLDRFVPGHPIAGTENSGPDAAFPDLYRNRRVVLTPLPENAPDAVPWCASAWEAVGARVTELPAADHDAALAAVSHLPHLLLALVDELAARPNGEQMFSFSGGGFRDFAHRIQPSGNVAGYLGNPLSAGPVQGTCRLPLETGCAAEALDAGDGAAMEALFDRARIARAKWLPVSQ